MERKVWSGVREGVDWWSGKRVERDPGACVRACCTKRRGSGGLDGVTKTDFAQVAVVASS